MRAERFARQVALPGFGEAAQRKLGSARVLVIGAGGLGSTVIPALAGAGVGTIGIVDDDRVELSNLHRQYIHGVADVGTSKVRSAAASVARINPQTRVVELTDRLTAANALNIFAEYDLVIDGCDNFPTRYLAHDAAMLRGIPLVWGSLSQYGGQTGLSVPGGPGYRDLFPAPPPPGSVLSCEQSGVLPTVCGVIASIMATEALKLFTGIGTPLIGRVTVFDALTGGFRELEFGRDPEATQVTELIDYELFCGIVDTVSARQLAEKLAAGEKLMLLDVREPWEAQIASLPGSVLVPLRGLAAGLDSIDRRLPIVAYCHTGVRSETARRLLKSSGFTVSHLAGGIDAWSREVDLSVARY